MIGDVTDAQSYPAHPLHLVQADYGGLRLSFTDSDSPNPAQLTQALMSLLDNVASNDCK